MSKYDERRQKACGLYIKDTLNRKQICEVVNVTEATLRKWITAGDWDSLKEAKTVTRQHLLLDAMAQLKAVNQKIAEMGNIPDKQLSDAKGVLRKEIEALSGTPLHQYAEVFDEFTIWLVSRHADRVAEIAQLQLSFLNELQNGSKESY